MKTKVNEKRQQGYMDRRKGVEPKDSSPEYLTGYYEFRVGFLAGSFDILHPGYIAMFQDAKTICDWLVVGLHSCKNLEDPNKIPPILSVEERVDKLFALRYVDHVIIYNSEAELLQLLKDIKPDIRILGTDYKNKSYTGMELDIPIYFHKRDHDWSTTKFKKLIAEQFKDK